jgi:phage anti-repressor protein
MKYSYYKNYPLIRKGNELYYGYMGDPYVAWLKIEHMNKEDAIETADFINVYRVSTKTNLPEQKAERHDLYDALDIAYAWLKKFNKK